MLRALSPMRGWPTETKDGPDGHVEDFVIDDVTWAVRFAVVDRRHWLMGSRKLVMPETFLSPDDRTHTFHLSLSRHQLENSPDAGAMGKDESVGSRVGDPSAVAATPGNAVALSAPLRPSKSDAATDLHAVSLDSLAGVKVRTSQGIVGRIADAAADDEHWIIRYLIVELSSDKEGPMAWIPTRNSAIRWRIREWEIPFALDQLRSSPRRKIDTAVDDQFAAALRDHYGEPVG